MSSDLWHFRKIQSGPGSDISAVNSRATMTKLVLLALVLTVAVGSASLADTVVPDVFGYISQDTQAPGSTQTVINQELDQPEQMDQLQGGTNDSPEKILSDLVEKAEDYSQSVSEYEAFVRTRAEACCIRKQKAVPQLVHTPTHVACNLDQQEAGVQECIDQAVSDMKLLVQGTFTASSSAYESANAECIRVTNATADMKTLMNSQQQSCLSLIALLDTAADQAQYQIKCSKQPEEETPHICEVPQKETPPTCSY